MVNKLAGTTRLWIHDDRLCDPREFFVDLNNIFPALRMARADFLRRWIEFGAYRRHPQPHLFFEGPNGGWVYVKDWVLNKQGKKQVLFLNKENFAQKEKCISAILDAYQQCEELWQKYEAARINHFEEIMFGTDQFPQTNLYPIGRKKV